VTIRSLLFEADGYVVVDAEGRRVGRFIELAAPSGSDGERVAIRRDRIFLWHRLLLPLDVVESVVPERGVVVLAVTRRALDHPDELDIDGWDATADGQPDAEWLTQRLEHYTPSADETPPPKRREQRAAPTARGAGSPAEQHLLFIPTSDGYFLAERDGPPPPRDGEIEAGELSGSFTVAKLAPSPLPDDARPCAYLQPLGSQTTAEARTR
jgi:hypothetical protein